MADEKKSSKTRQIRKPETVRQRAAKAGADKKPRRLRRAGATAAKPIKAAARIGRKEFYLPFPDNKAGRFLNKRRKVTPSYFVQSWNEVRQVKWPGRKETAKLTMAVFLFALFFGTIITLADYGLDKLFKQLILK